MRYFSKQLLFVSVLTVISGVNAQTPSYNIGRTPGEEEIRSWVNPVGSAGRELPAGSGTAMQGAEIYTQRCIFCHGPDGTNGPHNNLKGKPLRVYATTIWDYIYHAMPRSLANVGVQEMQLSADEVYALTAYMLHLNNIIGENDVMNEKTLPEVKMPVELIPDNLN
jgi:mono/diheme cytochrome c family protein